MRRLLQLLVLALALVSLTTPAQAVPPLPTPKLIAVYFWASWCPNCKLLSPVLDQARETGALDHQDVLFVKLDLSDKASIHQSVLLASALGIAPFVQAQGSATGYVAILGPDKKTELKRFDRTNSAEEIRGFISKTLASAPAQ